MTPLPEQVADSDYDRGFEDVKAAVIAGLERKQAAGQDEGAASYLVGALSAVVAMLWANREPEVQRLGMAASIGAVVGDVLASAATDDEILTEEPDQALALGNAIGAAVFAWAPRDADGKPIVLGDVILTALGAYAADVIASIPHRAQRTRVMAELASEISKQVGRVGARRTQIQGVMAQGGAA